MKSSVLGTCQRQHRDGFELDVTSTYALKQELTAYVTWLNQQGVSTRGEGRKTYSEIARRLNALLQYVEVNLTAVRKILKKFDKKVPAEFRVRKTQDYKEHHELFMISMQYVLVTAVQMQRLIAERVVDSEPLAVPVSQLGPESLAVLALATGPAVVDDVLGRVPATRIDVYAKPAGVGAAEPPTPIPAKPQAKPVPSVLPRKQQAGLVSRSPGSAPADEDDGDDDAPENQEPSTTGKTRRRGGRNNRKRGARRDSDPQPQPQQPQGQPMQPQQATQVHQGPPKGAKGSAKAKSQPKGRSTEAGQPVLAAGPVATERKSDFRPEYTQSPMAQLLLQQPMQCHVSAADSLAAATSTAAVPAATTTINAVSALCAKLCANGTNAHYFWAACVMHKAAGYPSRLGTAPVSEKCCSGSKFHLFHDADEHAKSDSVWRKRDEDPALERPYPQTPAKLMQSMTARLL
ncbi:hypothetical protein AK812_SmicGene10754 [Symbiodinium microadriaticum]|uniref:SPX domain-containing protein n=1 Tax=Symbiodinium microadriaticum TaxID=2951 RepID=A0A1Q9EF40_SYMMI|nr:hypothetical protein AK812_SmicGene10754 [Symbiodinium microadriaticum]